MKIPDSLLRAHECRFADWGDGIFANDYFYGMLDMYCELVGLDIETVYEELNDAAQARAEIQED
jgi:hypothetical protein